MKKIKVFLSLIVFAVCAAFNVSAVPQPKPTLIKMKAEKVERTAVAKAVASSFHSTDCLVMYETLQNDLFPATGRRRITIRESYRAARAGFSRFFRFKPVFEIKLNFSYA